ncbi:hypothetical protein DNK01_09600 [Stutzerimonas kirkiae]|nr:hypothetical protein DNK01_09600 [Stutzerimonas kirkiae]
MMDRIEAMTDRQWAQRHLALLHEPVPPTLAEQIGLLLVDTLAVANHARRQGIGATRIDEVLVTCQADGSGSRIWGRDFNAAPTDAALLNACAAEALDYQEVLINPRNNGHAAVVIVPALMALAEQRGIGGERLLKALWIAFAANIGLAEALGREHRRGQLGFRTTSLIAPIAAALGGAALLFDDAGRAAHAVAISASTLSAGLLAALSPSVGSYSEDKDLAIGFAARNAVQAVLLAEAGATGPTATLTGEHGWLASFGFAAQEPRRLWRDPREQDLGAYAIKPYPACFGCQSAIRAAIELSRRYRPHEVSRLCVEVNGTSAQTLSTRVIGNHLAARFSLPYAVASAFVRGRASLDEFAPAALDDPAVLAFMAHVEVLGSTELDQAQAASGGFPARLAAWQGTQRLASLEYAGPLDGLAPEARRAVFEEKLQRLVSPSLRERLLEVLANPWQIERLFRMPL